MKNMKWQPIETAPKDGSSFIGKHGSNVFRTWWQAFYDKWPHEEGGPTYRYAWAYCRGDAHMYTAPTHWIPMPDGLCQDEGGR